MSSAATTRADGPVVEVQGTWLANRGAELMLRTVVEQLRGRLPQAILAVDPHWGSFEVRAQLGLRQVFPREMPGARYVERIGATGRWLGGRRAHEYLEGYGIVLRRDVDVLLDASGFALSDQWGEAKARQRADRIVACVRNGGAAVVLPQAMGPFRDHGVRREAERVLRAASLVYVRDEESLSHVRSIAGGEAARLAPDLTVLSPPVSEVDRVADVLVVPNGRMLDPGTGWSADAYETALVAAVEAAQDAGRSVAVLVHAGDEEDRWLAEAVARRADVSVIAEMDAMGVKALVGSAEVVVGSRFHALLGALLQGVPTVMIGWSHKYRALAEEFGIGGLVVGPGEVTEARRMLADLLREGGARERHASRDNARRQAAASAAMWDEVVSTIRQQAG